ncbi:class A beta-lactamase [Qipengyuania marisflavi]|uniref:Beta-lactamase n=1 Tax=Qipengyuania marisflavi TaxID=2486356 RepID=A0A5S3PQH0_9SPHN|nr:class A beta-lactamase [Qipengyuania marisflavi]TMM45833.1 class A beta-lactamase [Qipengyuania marisflavi]
MGFDRRGVLAGAVALAGSACVPLHQSPDGRLAAKLAILERALGGTLGAAFYDVEQGLTLTHNAELRFPLCSTFKFSLAAMVLMMEQNGTLDTSQHVTWQDSDLLSHAPFTRERGAQGATLLELARAAQVASDNTAANLVLDRVGGPAALTAFWRALGDDVSRLDRMEPQLNAVAEDELRDTTTPAAMVSTLTKLIASDSKTPLGAQRQAILRQWMQDTATGSKLVRAGLPPAWEAGDKTGATDWPGAGIARADIGYTLSPGGTPVMFALYYRADRDAPPPQTEISRTFAEVGRVLTGWIRRNWTIVLT